MSHWHNLSTVIFILLSAHLLLLFFFLWPIEIFVIFSLKPCNASIRWDRNEHIYVLLKSSHNTKMCTWQIADLILINKKANQSLAHIVIMEAVIYWLFDEYPIKLYLYSDLMIETQKSMYDVSRAWPFSYTLLLFKC